MQKVLLTLTQAVTVKNVLRTDIARTILADPEVELILLAQNEERVAYYQEQFSHPRARYTVFYKTPHTPLETFLKWAKIYTLRTKTTNLRRLMVAHDSGNWLAFIGGHLCNLLLAHKRVRALLRRLEMRVEEPGAAAFLRAEKPDLLVLTNLFDDAEISLLREARRQGIAILGFINSWDRLTTRWSVRLLPDTMIVYNEVVKRDAMRHADMPPERITLTGIPQYDRFITDAPEDRSVFFAKKGLDPDKRLVLVAPMGPTFSDSDWLLIDLLHEWLVGGAIKDAQMLVRFQPNEALDTGEIEKRPWLLYDAPGVRFGSERGGDWDMPEEDLKNLNSELKLADVLVTYTSSISIDAAICSTPVVNVAFLLQPVKEWLKTPTFYYGTEHHSTAVASGGFHLAKSREELLAIINAYLADRSLDSAGRARLAREQGYLLDGKAGERIGRAILAALPDKQGPPA